MKIESLHDLYIEELQDLYSAEEQLTKALPKQAKAATSPELKAAFEQHLEQTRQQLERVGALIESLEQKPGKVTCKAMKGLVAECEEKLKEDMDPEVLDAALIVGAQKIEHYEIAGYGSVRTFARLLGRREDAVVLEEILDQEKQTDELLTGIAERLVNRKAVA